MTSIGAVVLGLKNWTFEASPSPEFVRSRTDYAHCRITVFPFVVA
jgi:hypothetical protein